ncbi:histidine phosphatase family protein [Alphaproteobacteria bacterium]|nr:histidine phosphatase family protein [Alphaproteobacteria bacterium]
MIHNLTGTKFWLTLRIGRMRLLALIAAGLFVSMIGTLPASTPAQAQAEAEAANVIFMRHALAPGTGDPANFNIDDCTTQRVLNDAGREQARALGRQLGAYLDANNKKLDAILTSQWCRCRDTAILLDLGEWQEFTGLNSFFNGHVDRDETLALLRARLDDIGPDELVLMVTHQVIITAITGIFPPSGGMVLYNTETGAVSRLTLP